MKTPLAAAAAEDYVYGIIGHTPLESGDEWFTNDQMEKAFTAGAHYALSEGVVKDMAEALDFDKRLDIDCGDNSCKFAKKKTGMRTNGGCRCEDFFSNPNRLRELLNVIFNQKRALAAYKQATGGG